MRLRLFADDDEVANVAIVTRPYFNKHRALLCCDCDALFETGGTQYCPACGSGQAVPAVLALDRKNEGELEDTFGL